nr:hypothetical protein [Bacteroidota bacterium]
MNFEDFRKDIESKLDSIDVFELQEFRFEPYSFGNGILAFKINGRFHKFIFDGRDNKMSWLLSESHQKYYGANFKEYKRIDGLILSTEELENGIK